MPGPIARRHINNIIKLYRSGMSVQNIAQRVGVNLKTADKYIRESGAPKRTKAETAALISRSKMGSAPTRPRKPIPSNVESLYASGMTIRQIAERHALDRKHLSEYLKAAGHHVSHGRTTEARIQVARRASESAKLAPRNDEQSARTRQRTLQMVGQGELSMIEALGALGLDCAQQFPVGSYNLDIAIKELHVAVEVQRGSWHGSTSAKRERIEYLLDRGWRVVFVQVSRNGAASDWTAIADKLVATLHVLRGNPSAGGQYGVLRRDGKPCTRLPAYFDDWARIPGL